MEYHMEKLLIIGRELTLPVALSLFLLGSLGLVLAWQTRRSPGVGSAMTLVLMILFFLPSLALPIRVVDLSVLTLAGILVTEAVVGEALVAAMKVFMVCNNVCSWSKAFDGENEDGSRAA